MGKIHKAAAAAVLLAAFAGSAEAAIVSGAPDFKLNLFENFLGLNAQLAGQIKDIAQDSANRTWFATQGMGAGAAVITGTALGWAGPPFPLRTGDTGYLLSDDLSSVVFANMSQEEHFFLGSSGSEQTGGIQAGRIAVGADFVGNRLYPDEAVSALATKGGEDVWVGTASGLHRVDISGNAPVDDPLSLAVTDPVLHVVDVSAAFNGTSSVAYVYFDDVANSHKIGIHREGSLFSTRGLHSTDNRVDALFFQADCVAGSPCLWTVEHDLATAGQRWLVRYDNLSTPTPTVGMATSIQRECFDATDPCNPSDLAINGITGEFWLTTGKGAYFQIPAPDPLDPLRLLFSPRFCGAGALLDDPSDDNFNGDPCNAEGTGWRPVPRKSGDGSTPDAKFGAVLADPAGNVWLGSNEGLRALVVRFLILDRTRYIGIDRRVLVTFADGTVTSGTELSVTVKVGSNEETIPGTADANGIFQLSFGFTDAPSDPLLEPHLFTVVPSVEGVDILVTYSYQLPGETLPRKLEARATWAEIVPFEDDLWIGGPCFLDLLLPRTWGAAR